MPERGPGFRPPWWPENEPFPPDEGAWRSGQGSRRGGPWRGGPWRGGPWRGRPGRFMHRIGLAFVVFFALTFVTSGLAVALLSGALGVGRHRGFAISAGVLGLGLLFGGFVAAGRAFRGMAAPLSDVMDAADHVAGGDYRVRVEERGGREMRRLARSFNTMVERLQASEEQRRNLLADVAHELRTPLTVIQGNAEGMLDGLYPADRAHMEPLLEETRVMSRLLDDLQTLSTAEAGVLELHREPAEPRALVEDAAAAFGSQAQNSGVTIEHRAAPGLPPLDVDPVRIGEVLANLLSNAVRATPAGGSVIVSADHAGNGRDVVFAVGDSGPGIPPDILAHVFDRFVKAADSGGAGLGLAIARKLVEAHGGTITAESSPGHGTTMRFTLPTPPG